MEMSRLESMLFSLKKEKNERENELLTLRGELNVLLNLPGDTMVELSLSEDIVLVAHNFFAWIRLRF